MSEYAVDGKEFFFEGVWLCVCDFISEEDVIKEFTFFFGYGVAVEEVSRYSPS